MILRRYRQKDQPTKVTVEGVEVYLLPRLVYLHNDEKLQLLFQQDKLRASYLLSKQIKKKYFACHGKQLLISTASLSAEILGHYWVDNAVQWWMKALPFPPFKKMLLFIHARTKQFDCGEASIDTNRWVWDMIALVCKRWLVVK